MHVAVTATIGQSIQYDNNKSAGHYIPVNGIKLYYEEYGKNSYWCCMGMGRYQCF